LQFLFVGAGDSHNFFIFGGVVARYERHHSRGFPLLLQRVLRTPFGVYLETNLRGVLRLRGCFAMRSSHFAQDDKCYLESFASDEVDQIAHPARVSPLIVVPGDDFHQIANHQRAQRIYDRGAGIAAEVG
jgi:hypothetical protein